MLTLRRWEPYGTLRRMEREMDSFWGPRLNLFRRWPTIGDSQYRGHIPIDVYEDAHGLVIKATLPGIKPEDLELTVADNVLTIKGETKIESEVKDRDYLHRERSYGTFHRTVTLPRNLDVEKAETSHEEGVLTITFPKKEEAKPKTLKINVHKSLPGKPDK